MKLRNIFGRFADFIARQSGHSTAFIAAVSLIVVWALTGPIFGFSESWQLVVNTATTIVTFLMVFVLQNTQNRNGEALHAKLDELILSSKAENRFIEAERLSEEEIGKLRRIIEVAAEKAAEADVAAGKAEAAAETLERAQSAAGTDR
jgi:low affinity Fe/Cu permease